MPDAAFLLGVPRMCSAAEPYLSLISGSSGCRVRQDLTARPRGLSFNLHSSVNVTAHMLCEWTCEE